MATLYQAFGYSAFEGEIDGGVQKRIIFAVALANKPGWLSWYVYAESLPGWARNRFDYSKTGIPYDQGWDKINVFGSMLSGGSPGAFKLQNYIDVNQFADFRKGHSGMGRGSAYIWRKDDTISAIIRVEIDPLISKNVEVADFVLKFKRERDLLNDMDVRRAGSIWLLGSVKYTASAVTDGPVLSKAVGNTSAFSRFM